MLVTRLTMTTVVLIGMAGNGWAREHSADAPIPPSLRPWVPWVLDSDEGKNARCPSLVGASEPACEWPARLALDLGKRGGTFRQEWTLFRAGLIDLPGDKEHWPRGIMLDGKAAPVVDVQGGPKIQAPLGQHTVTGSFLWDSLPESLAVPAETGLVALSLRGAPVRFPMRENDGRLFLGQKEPQEASEKVEEDRVDVSVYRKLTDAVPLRLTTRLVLAVSGKNRELLLARALPEGFAPTVVESRLPARFEADGRLRLQTRPGQWTIDVEAHRVGLEKSITRPVPDGLWKEGDEVWVFEAVPDLRTVSVTGAPAIDPAQTLLPEPWKSFPAYAMAPGARLDLVEEKRGNSEPAPERLSLERALWLDSDGGAWSVHDKVVGEFTRAWRLDVDRETRLGRLAVDGKDQFLTVLGQAGPVGVEIRGGKTSIDADSRIDHRAASLPATSFVHDFERVSATLHLPLGWDLLHARGADQIAGSWVERWSLGQLVLLGILVLALARLYGVRIALVGLLALGLTLLDSDAPAAVWLLVIGAEVAVRALGSGQPQRVARVLRLAVWAILVLQAIPFVKAQASFALHPATAMDRAEAPRFSSFVSETLGFAEFRRGGTAARESTRMMLAEPAEQTIGALVGQDVDSGLAAVGGLGSSGAGRPGESVKNASRFGLLKGGASSQAGLRDLSTSGSANRYASAPQPASPTLNAAAYDPSMVVQTGEGLPGRTPTWRSATLSFSGPVKSDRHVRLYLVPPWLSRMLAAAAVLLPLVLAWSIWRKPLRLRGTPLASKPMFTGLLALMLLVPLSARAEDFPSQDMLDALRKRVQPEPECAPECAAMNDMVVRVAPNWLTITLGISAAKPSALILPGDAASWSPTEVRVGGKPATELARASDGKLLIALGTGLFSVELGGPLPARESIQIPLPMRPHHASSTATGFEVSGIHEDGAVDESLQLTRIASAKRDRDDKGDRDDKDDKGAETESAPTLPAFLRVERTLQLGLKWEVSTRVVRETPAGTPVVVEIPLLPGESVTTSTIRTEKSRGTVSLSFGPTDTEIAWQSTLAERAAIQLRADPANASRWSEVWRAEVGPVWHATFAGIPPMRPALSAATRVPEWHPWPGEVVDIVVEKPGAAPGQTKTIDASSLVTEPGLHDSHVSLALEMRTSQSATHVITLPEAADDLRVVRDNAEQPVRRQGADLTLTLPPGSHSFTITWRQPTALSTVFRTPVVDLHLPSANSSVTIRLGEKPRWVVWLSGPSMGPYVQFWAALVLLLLASLGLGRWSLTPLRARHWFLLGLGLLQVAVLPVLAVPALLLALGLRARHAPDVERPLRYDLGQVALLVLLVMSVIVLVNVADLGLWRTPGMLIAGNNATASHLEWIQDRTGPLLARPTLISLPLWAYRMAAIAWFLWLAIALFGWAGWAWTCFKQHGLWRPLSRPVNLPPSP
jgi:hypothetical protein